MISLRVIFLRRSHFYFISDFSIEGRVNKTIRELKHERFLDEDGNRKWAIFTFNLPSHSHIHIAKYLFSIRDEWYKNLGDNTVLAHEMLSSGCRLRLKNARV